MKDNCSECRFFIFQDPNTNPPTQGVCRKYPPKIEYYAILPNGMSMTQSLFPAVQAFETWCGEWVKKTELKLIKDEE